MKGLCFEETRLRYFYNTLADATREGPGEKGLPLAVSKDNEELAKLRVYSTIPNCLKSIMNLGVNLQTKRV